MTAAEPLLRQAERVADRLRVVGPRMAARESHEAAQVLADVREALQRLADVAARAEGVASRPVPALGAHALGDQVLVLAHDLVAVGDEIALRDGGEVLAGLARLI